MAFFLDNAGGLFFLSEDDLARGGASLLPDGATKISDTEGLALEAARQPKQVADE